MQQLDEFEWLRLRIYDLYYLFPHLASEISFPRANGSLSLKREFLSAASPYDNLPDKKRLFSEMGDYQVQALQVLLAKDIFRAVGDNLRLSEGFHNPSVQSLLEEKSSELEPSLTRLFATLNKIQLSGEKGLKKRTGLMEYRYDAV